MLRIVDGGLAVAAATCAELLVKTSGFTALGDAPRLRLRMCLNLPHKSSPLARKPPGAALSTFEQHLSTADAGRSVERGSRQLN